MAVIVITLPPDSSIDMTTSDTLQFVFDEGGLFCSKDGGTFTPVLPHDRIFAAGQTWPDKKDYPNGASVSGECDAEYAFLAGASGKCADQKKRMPMQPIHVGSGAV